MIAERWLWYRRWRRLGIVPGDVYEDCSYHPCVCLAAVPYSWPRGWRRWLHLRYDTDLTGISLWDLSIHGCSARHCAPYKLNIAELVKSLYYHADDKSLLERGDLQESIQQMKEGKIAAGFIPYIPSTPSRSLRDIVDDD